MVPYVPAPLTTTCPTPAEIRRTRTFGVLIQSCNQCLRTLCERLLCTAFNSCIAVTASTDWGVMCLLCVCVELFALKSCNRTPTRTVSLPDPLLGAVGRPTADSAGVALRIRLLSWVRLSFSSPHARVQSELTKRSLRQTSAFAELQ